LQIINYQKNEIRNDTFAIIGEFLFGKQNSFFSFTSTTTEVSIVLSSERFDNFHPSQSTKKLWRAWQVDSNNNPDTVSSLSSILAANNIPLLYLSTFNHDYLFVPADVFNDSLSVIRDSGIEILN